MNFDFTDEQLAVQQMAKNFANEQIKPIASHLDEEAKYPENLISQMAELGLMGIAIPAEYGGSGMDYVSYVLAMEEISSACAGTGVIMSVNNSLVCDPLLKYGTEEQKREILTPLASGKMLGCFALTEPGSGSDAGALRTTAKKDKNEYILNGEKNFITNAPQADWAIVFATIDRSLKHKGVTAFLVPLKSYKGVTVGPKEKKLGIRASWSSSIILEDVRIPEKWRLGKEGEGFKVAMTTLDAGRIGIAAQALGIAKAALEESIEYAKQRQTFGKPIAQHQAIGFMIADMATKLDAARLLTLHAAWKKDRGERHTVESSMAKLFAAETAMEITTKAIQIHGGYGYLKDYPVERHFRDAKITEIYEGTSEIQRLVIASSIFKETV